MDKLLHTPWKADIEGDIFDTNGGYSIDIINSMGETVGKAVGKIRETVERNAKVYAAAPEMFDIIKELYDWTNNAKVFGPIYPKLESIIKKATE